MQGIHVGLKDVPDPIEETSSEKAERKPDAENPYLEDLTADDDFLGERDKPFGWPMTDETVDTEFIPPRGDTYCCSADGSDPDYLGREFVQSADKGEGESIYKPFLTITRHRPSGR